MDFRTEIEIPQGAFPIDHKSKGLLMGSCFADSIGAKMLGAGFRVTVNPFGALYNPRSVADSIGILASGRKFNDTDMVDDGELWHSFAFHGSFSSPSREASLGRINKALTEGARVLGESDYVILTVGTSWIYKLASSGEVVANCHKRPAKEFIRSRMSVQEIVDLFTPLLEGVLAGKQVLLTVSPIRHLKDGFVGNQISKSTLVVSAHELSERYSNVSYFPSYEIMMDDLRDYRFYDRDMIHPSAQAVDYIWEKFSHAYFSDETLSIASQAEEINKALAHRPFNPNTHKHKAFVEATMRKKEALQKEHPYIYFE